MVSIGRCGVGARPRRGVEGTASPLRLLVLPCPAPGRLLAETPLGGLQVAAAPELGLGRRAFGLVGSGRKPPEGPARAGGAGCGGRATPRCGRGWRVAPSGARGMLSVVSDGGLSGSVGVPSWPAYTYRKLCALLFIYLFWRQPFFSMEGRGQLEGCLVT